MRHGALTLSVSLGPFAGLECEFRGLAIFPFLSACTTVLAATCGGRLCMQLSTAFDLDNPLREDDEFDARTEFMSIRKPHALSRTQYIVGGGARPRCGC